MQDFDSGLREKVSRPAKLEGFSSRLSALSSEGTSLIAIARGSVGRGPRCEKVLSQGIEDTITCLQHKMESYKKLERRASVHLSSISSSSSSASKNISKRFSMGNFDEYSIIPKLELGANPLPAASRLFPEKKREGLRRGGSMRVERSMPVQKLSNKFESFTVDDSYRPTPPERVDSFKYLKTNVNSLRQKFEQLTTTDTVTPSSSSSSEDLSSSAPAGGIMTKKAESPGKEPSSQAKQKVPLLEKANTMPQLGVTKASLPTKRFNILKHSSEHRAESPKVSPQAIEAILKSLSVSSDNGDKLTGGVVAGDHLSQQLYKQLPQLEESSDEEELNKEMESLLVTTG